MKRIDDILLLVVVAGAAADGFLWTIALLALRHKTGL